jgi:N utilization substance protein B
VVNRRHIRVKVMQSIYAMHQNGSDNLKEEKFLLQYRQHSRFIPYNDFLNEICKRESFFT